MSEVDQRAPESLSKCPYCENGRQRGDRYSWTCDDCDGLGVVCSLCRKRLELCECGGVLVLCPRCNLVPAACKCFKTPN
jgi:hypothetical protein